MIEKITAFINSLQDKPLEVRNRIFWASSAVAAVLVFGIWLTTFKHEVKKLTVGSVTNIAANQPQVSSQHYVTVNAAQTSANKLLLYFSINNDTKDILNVANLSSIKLAVNGKTYSPSKLTDANGGDFIQKALSHSENFGILTFDTISGSGEITFDNMFFEQSPDNLFKEVVPVDLKALPKPKTLRN